MNFNSKRSVTDEQNERHKRLLASILKEEGNKSCADCKTRNPTWASVNLGVFVCLTCSGIHRSLGVHISQVRSCNLDTWLPKQVEYCRVMGNTKGNRYWEARLPKDFRRPPSGNPNPELASFIRAKYVDHAFAATESQPPTIDNYLDHPYGAEPETSSATAVAPATAAPTLLRAAPASASSPALTVDLLGGFDELAVMPTLPVLPSSPAAVQTNGDPFSYGSFVSAPPVSASSTAQLNSLEWTDFHAAAPPAVSSAPTTGPPAVSDLLLSQTSSGHHRSYSISEGVATAPSAMANQPSRFGHSKALSSTQPQHEPHKHHSRTQSHQAVSLNHNEQQKPHAPRQPTAQLNSAGYASMPDDLLAGLTIHHVMESMAAPSGNSSAGGSTVTADPFQFSSSAAPGDIVPLARPSGHKRHPSNVKSAEEILRLFDAEPSTGASSGSVAQVGAGEDPFGDFLSGGTYAAPNGVHKQQLHSPSNGVATGGVSNFL